MFILLLFKTAMKVYIMFIFCSQPQSKYIYEQCPFFFLLAAFRVSVIFILRQNALAFFCLEGERREGGTAVWRLRHNHHDVDNEACNSAQLRQQNCKWPCGV